MPEQYDYSQYSTVRPLGQRKCGLMCGLGGMFGANRRLGPRCPAPRPAKSPERAQGAKRSISVSSALGLY